jgi:hypothetical protein
MYPERAYPDAGLIVHIQDPVLPYWPKPSAICCNDRSCSTSSGLSEAVVTRLMRASLGLASHGVSERHTRLPVQFAHQTSQCILYFQHSNSAEVVVEVLVVGRLATLATATVATKLDLLPGN